MMNWVIDGIEVSDVAVVSADGVQDDSTMSMFNEHGDIMVRLLLSNGVALGVDLKCVRDEVRAIMEGHRLSRSDYRRGEVPRSVVCNLQPREDGFTVRFDDTENSAFWAELDLIPQVRDRVCSAVIPEAEALHKHGDEHFIRRPKKWRYRPFLPLTHRTQKDSMGLGLPALLTESYVDQPLVFPVNMYDTPQFGGNMTPDQIMRTAMAYSSLDAMLEDWQVD